MTNKEKWLAYTDGLTSPQNYIEWSWRYVISASLQRRVWLPPGHNPCFANQYLILVGKAGLGKGLCIVKVHDLISHWKLKDRLKLNGELKTQEEKETVNVVAESDLKNAQEVELQTKNKQNSIVEPGLLPIAADATTYEALVESVANSYMRINYIEYDEKLQKDVLKIYGHSSVCFVLPELASLLRKRTDDTVNYLLGIYDCPTDYTYKTKSQGVDRVRRGCLNILGGTTPDFMQTIFDSGLINQGFGSRTFFAYADEDRKVQFWIPELTEEQKEYRKDLLNHIRKLTTLYGQVKMSEQTKQFLEDWWKGYAKNIPNIPKLDGYFSRKKVHVMKVAMCEHFGESTEMEIPTETYERAIGVLAEEEKNMNLAITLGGTNPIANISREVLKILKRGRKDFVDLMVDVFNIANKSQLEEALSFLMECKKVVAEQEREEKTDETIMYYRLK